MSKTQGKMANLINYRIRVTVNDGRQLTGTLLAFDKHMNIVLADTEEFRRIKKKPTKAAPATQTSTVSEEKRTLGLIILRGNNIVALSVEGPPPADPSSRLGTAPTTGPTGAAGVAAAGPGIARPVGRGLPILGMGLPGAPQVASVPPPGAPPVAGLAGPMRGMGPMPGMPGVPPPGMAMPAGMPPPPGFAAPPGFQPPPGGRGYPPPPPGFQGR